MYALVPLFYMKFYSQDSYNYILTDSLFRLDVSLVEDEFGDYDEQYEFSKLGKFLTKIVILVTKFVKIASNVVKLVFYDVKRAGLKSPILMTLFYGFDFKCYSYYGN